MTLSWGIIHDSNVSARPLDGGKCYSILSPIELIATCAQCPAQLISFCVDVLLPSCQHWKNQQQRIRNKCFVHRREIALEIFMNFFYRYEWLQFPESIAADHAACGVRIELCDCEMWQKNVFFLSIDFSMCVHRRTIYDVSWHGAQLRRCQPNWTKSIRERRSVWFKNFKTNQI